ncbi:MAG: BspA family leucine-rich repeat surface protein [Prevotella sp.]|nr:BspA family leucine-rich repeat surface protein [Prevotella sp.]
MKKLFTFMAAMLTACMAFAQADQTFQFVDKDGNVVADGSTIVVSELNEEGMMVVPLFVKNMSGEKAAVSMYETIDAMPNGQWQTCAFGNCMLLTETGYSSKSIVGADFDAGIETEWIPVAGQYATWTATLQIHVFNIMTQTKFGVTTEVAGNNVIGHGPTVNVRFEYKNPSATQEVYTVYSPDGTLTYYYDGQKASRQGTVYDMSFTRYSDFDDYCHYGWSEHTYSQEGNAAIQKIVLDPSMAAYHPTSISGWFAAYNVTSIEGMEYLNTDEVTDMSGLFCTAEVQSLDLSHFNTSKVTNMLNMFNGCVNLTSIDLSHFDTGNVTNMSGMFATCQALNSLDVTTLNTQNVVFMSSMFLGLKLTSIDLSHFNTSKVQQMEGMFAGSSFTSLDLSSFNTSEVLNMDEMFQQCKMTSLDLSNFDVSNVYRFENMFYQCENLKTLNLGNFNSKTAQTMKNMFRGCVNLENLDVSHFITSNVSDMESMFYQCRSLKTLDVSHFDTRNVESMGWMFGECTSLESLDVSHFDTSNTWYFKGMFDSCGKLKKIDVSHFDTSKARSEMSAMFKNCSSLESLDLSHFNTANVGYFINMFMNCTSLKTLDLSSFETTNVIASHNMFNGCSNLQTVDLTNFTVEKNNSLFSMFAGCSNLTTIYCNHDWAEGKTLTFEWQLTNFANMFTNCNKLVGGNGTVYNPENTNVLYAHVDVAGNPGYFTSKTSGIATTTVSQTAEASRFSLDGRRLSDSHKGINLIRKSDGSVRKVMVK